MTGYTVRRVLQAVLVLWGVSVIVFALIHLVPGDPVRLALGTRFDPATYQALRDRAGLDEPFVVQYFDWIGGALTGDLGVSFRSGQPVSLTILDRLPATLSLAGGAIVVALAIAAVLGVVSALRPRSPFDHAATVLSQIGISVPEFWMGILLILVFSLHLDWLPSAGYVPLTEDPLEWARHLVLPAVSVGLVSGSILTRFVRASVLESMSQNHVRTARSKGLPERVVVRRHGVRNALIPIVTVTGVQLAYLLSGVVVVEIVFAWRGLGLLSLEAVQSRDYPVLQGAVLLFAIVFLVINLVVDLLYAYLDPRISYS